MEKMKQKVGIIVIIFIIFTPSFLFFKVPLNSSFSYSPIPLKNSNYIENSILTPETSLKSESINQKISRKFQALLKTQDLTQKVTCIILLKEQPTETVANQIKSNQNIRDRFLLRKMIYAETKKLTLPMQNTLVRPISLLGGKILQNFVIINAIVVEIPLRALPKLAELPQIARIEPDYKLHIQLDVSQPIVTNTTYPGWDFTYNGSGVIVAVCDSGIDKNHPNLIGRVIDEKSFIPGEDEDDYNGHGTHVAGIIASNDSTYHGITSEVDLVNVKILDQTGEGQTTYLVSGIEWLINETARGADVINLSAGTDELTANGEESVTKFVDAIVSQYGIVWIIAAGNSGSAGIEVPGDARNCISVANFNDQNSQNPSSWIISGTSSRGPTVDGRKKPDIAAPGTNIMSCNYLHESQADFIPKSGTSMSTPHVAGATALLWQYINITNSSLDLSWYPLIIKGILLNTAYDLGTAGYDYSYGYGAIDLGAVWNFLSKGDFEVETMNRKYGKAKYSITLDTPQLLNITVVWNRYATTNFTHNSFYDLSDIDIELKDANNNLLAYSSSNRDNVEHISYSATNGTYYLYVVVDTFKHDPQEYVVVASTSLTLIEKIKTWELTEILLIISIIGMIIIGAIYVILWLRERNTKISEKENHKGESTFPEGSKIPEY